MLFVKDGTLKNCHSLSVCHYVRFLRNGTENRYVLIVNGLESVLP